MDSEKVIQQKHEHDSDSPDRDRLPKHVSGWIEWQDDHLFCNGMVLLTAVPVCNYSGQPKRGWHYEYEVVHVSCDEHFFSLSDANGDGWGWEIQDVDFYIILRN